MDQSLHTQDEKNQNKLKPNISRTKCKFPGADLHWTDHKLIASTLNIVVREKHMV